MQDMQADFSRIFESDPVDPVQNGRIGGREARARGIPSVHPQPDPVACEFCGRELWHSGVYLWGTILAWHPLPERCDCERAREMWVALDAQEAKENAEREREARQKMLAEQYARLLDDSGIKRRFRERTLDAFRAETAEQKKAIAICARFCETFPDRMKDGRGLYIVGSNGTGKTHLAVACAHRIMRGLHSVIFRTYGDLLDEIREESRMRGAPSELELSRIFRECDLLILDDLGKELCSDWSMSFLYGIINARYEAMLPTIVTTNYDGDKLVRALTPVRTGDNQKARAIVSRLCECCVRVTLTGEDRRMQKSDGG